MTGSFGLRSKRLPLVLQNEQNECGMACVVMVLGYFGHHTSLHELRSSCRLSSQGSSLNSLINISDRAGLRCRPLRLECEELEQLSLPAILHWDLDHFVVLASVRKNRVSVHDPATGVRTLSREELSQHFTGVALELLPGMSFRKKPRPPSLALRDLWGQSHGLVPALLQIFCLSVMIQLFSLGMPFFTQLFIDDVLVNRDFDLLQVLAMGFMLVMVFRIITEYLRARAVLFLSNTISRQFTTNVFRHLLHLPLDFFTRRHMGDILSRFGSLAKIRDFLSSGIVEVVIDGLLITGTLALMFLYSGLLTGVALIAVVAYALFRFGVHGMYQKRNEEVLVSSARENTQFMENIRSVQGIKMFGRETSRLTDWQQYYTDVINSTTRLKLLGINIRLINGLLLGTENILLMFIGGYLVLGQQLSVGMVIAYFSFKDQFYSRVFALIDKLFEIRLLRLHLERLADIALTETENSSERASVFHEETSGRTLLEMADIGFRYADDSPWLFRHVSMTLQPDQCVAVTGPSGCGKSTLLRILLSLYQPTEGEVRLSGQTVASIGLNAYRRRVAGVLQDDKLLTGSIADNITFFEAEPDQQRMMEVAEKTAILTDIQSMPMQFNTLIGNMGIALSAGQIQRLLLARALYSQPEVLILDEATSHLDVRTEQQVNATIGSLDIARLVVAHRPQTILQADRIVHLDTSGLHEISKADFLAYIQKSQPVPAAS